MSDTHDTMFDVACRRAAKHGHGQSKRGNHRVEIDGPYVPLWTFVGLIHRIKGTLTCYYYDREIFAIDFTNARVTDFNMLSYSVSTTNNIHAWMAVCRRMFPSVVAAWRGHWSCWTLRQGGNGRYVSNWVTGPQVDVIENLLERFVKRVPWVYEDRYGIRWFAWEKFDEPLASAFHNSSGFLSREQNWRYFDFDWDSNGEWTRRFKSDDAKRRWEQRKRKRELAQRRRAA